MSDLFERWCAYYTMTEEFDRSRCPARDRDGTAMPMDGDERRDCSANARRVMEHLGLYLDRSDEIATHERNAARRMTHENQRRVAEGAGLLKPPAAGGEG